jgi:L-asparaginase II
MFAATHTRDAHPVLVEALRGGVVESQHRGAVAVVDARGHVLLALGDIQRPVFPRSAVKLLQALPLVATGAAEAFGLVDEELALACASHNGEARHANTAAQVLGKLGLDASALECGSHWPYLDTATRALLKRDEAPSALHNNCSGKHSGFVCLGCHLSGAQAADERRRFVSGYIASDHRVMREVSAALAAATDTPLDQAAMGTDGCSIPTYAIPLRQLALGFARVAAGTGLAPDHQAAALRLRQAIARAPFMVAGTGRFDTDVMQRLGARVCCKVGAEGVYCAALPEQGLGVAIKCDDGNNARACEVVMAAVIEALVRLDDAERRYIEAKSALRLTNWRGIEVGSLQASAGLRRALGAVKA